MTTNGTVSTRVGAACRAAFLKHARESIEVMKRSAWFARLRHGARFLTLGIGLVFGHGLSQAAPVFDVAADFSPASNPNGVWQYGWSTTAGAAFVPYSQRFLDPAGLDVWTTDPAVPGLSVTHNGTASNIVISDTIWAPGRVVFHPGPIGQNSVIRWTAPLSGLVALNSSFQGRDSGVGATSDIRVFHNGVSLFSGTVIGFGPAQATSFLTNVSVLSGDRIDFSVGMGPNGTFSSDSTQIDAVLSYSSSVPEIDPAGLGSVLALVGGSLGVLERRRRRTA